MAQRRHSSAAGRCRTLAIHDDRRPTLAPRSPTASWRSACGPCRRPASAASSTSRRRWTTSSASGWGSPTSTRRGSSSRPASRACARAGRTTRATSGRSSCGARCRATSSAATASRYDPATEILVTVGASEAVDLALRATCDPGDEVILHEPSYVAYVAGDRLRRRRRASRRDPVRGRLRARSGRGRGGDHAADQGALPRLPVQPDRRGPARRRPGRARRHRRRATTCSSTATRSTTGSPTARTATGRSAPCPACASGRS